MAFHRCGQRTTAPAYRSSLYSDIRDRGPSGPLGGWGDCEGGIAGCRRRNSRRRGRQSVGRDLFRSSSYFPLFNYMFSSIIEAKLKLARLCPPPHLYRLNLPINTTSSLLPQIRPSPSCQLFPPIFYITNRSRRAIPALRESKEKENKVLYAPMTHSSPS